MKKLFYLFSCAFPFLVKGQGNLKSLSISNKITQGIYFEQDLTWQEIKNKAKATKKYIFLDCFATWCGPCKLMDRTVYTNNEVGKLMNEKFISVKVQMDQTAYDNEFVKNWYSSAKEIGVNYNVSAYPTFLFFSPDGVPIHKAVGYRNPDDFLSVVNEAFDYNKQYYSILNKFSPGKMDTAEEKGLARSFSYTDKKLGAEIAFDYLSRIPLKELMQKDNLSLMSSYSSFLKIQQLAISYFKSLNKSELANNDNQKLLRSFNKCPEVINIAIDYLKGLDKKEMAIKRNLDFASIFREDPKVKELANQYIDNLSEEEVYSKNNILFISAFTRSSKDKGFDLFYNNAKKIDSIMNNRRLEGKYMAPDYAERIVTNIIGFEEVNKFYDEALKRGNDKNLNWKDIERTIKKKYNKLYSDRVILTAKASLYQQFASKTSSYWKYYIRSNIDLIKAYGTDTTSGFADATQLNGFCWNVFVHSNKKKELIFVLKLMNGVVRRRPDDDGELDTYANILYKLGRKIEALKWEEKALNISISHKDEIHTKIFRETSEKMKMNKPTWLP